MKNTSLILASTSVWRRDLLLRVLDNFSTEDPAVDESRTASVAPEDVAAELAMRKALTVQQRFPDCVVIGSDQVVSVNGTILGKPGSADRARAQLGLLRGRTHELLTAVAIAAPERGTVQFTDRTCLTMRALSDDEIRRYVDRDQPLTCAGSYRIEAGGIALFERIATEDFTAIIGLPLMRVTSELRRLGFALP